MERLTIHNGMYKRLDPEQAEAIYKKLRAYEDTGSEPEEIKNSITDATDLAKVAMALRKLRNYEIAEQEGRLVVLPCKVGDTVYHPLLGEGKVETIYIRSMVLILVVFDDESHLFPIAEFGESVFTSRAEAEGGQE